MNARQYFLSIFLVLMHIIPAYSGWSEPVPVFEINSDYEEWSPFLSSDGLTLYFARVRTSESYYGRIFEAIRDEHEVKFTTIRELPGDINSFSGHVFCPWVSCDNLRMYYNTQSSDGWKLKVSERASISDSWPKGTDISELNAIGRYLHMAKLTADEKIIVFQGTDIPGGKGGHDIWMASRSDRNAPFEYYRNMQEINTTHEEAHPSISPDGLTLYFTSDRSGTEQLFQATRTSLDMPFGNVEHLSVFDTPNGNSAHAGITSDGKTMYFIKRTSLVRGAIWNVYVSYYSGNGTSYHNKLSTDPLYEIVEKNNESE